MGLAAPALAEFGATDALEGVAAGTRIVTAALTEAVGDVYAPSTCATGGKLTGEKVCVPRGAVAPSGSSCRRTTGCTSSTRRRRA